MAVKAKVAALRTLFRIVSVGSTVTRPSGLVDHSCWHFGWNLSTQACCTHSAWTGRQLSDYRTSVQVTEIYPHCCAQPPLTPEGGVIHEGSHSPEQRYISPQRKSEGLPPQTCRINGVE